MALDKEAEDELLGWIPVDSRWNFQVHAVKITGAVTDTTCLSSQPMCTTESIPDAIRDNFYQRLHDPLRTSRRDEILILAEVVRLSSNGAHPGGPFVLDSCRSGKDFVFRLAISLGITSFKRMNSRYGIWRPFTSRQWFTQIDHIPGS